MTDPFAVLPLALASGNGRVDTLEAQQLVAAGFTLLQRSAPLARALSGRRSAVLLPTSPAFLTALAASDGRGAVLVNPLAAAPEIAYQLAEADVGAVFTTSALAGKLPDTVARVLLDDAPRSARVLAGGASSDVDLGSHHGLLLEGDATVEGRDEEAAVVYTSAMAGWPLGAILTHRNLLANARSTIDAMDLSAGDHTFAALPWSHLFGLVVTGIAPLLAGARVTTDQRFHPLRLIDRLENGDLTQLVGVPSVFAALLSALQRRGAGLRPTALRVCICGGAPLDPLVQDRWIDATGIELRQGYGLTEAGPVCLFNRVDRPNRRGTLGVAFPGVDVEIHDPATGRAVADGAEGEICVRGPNVFRGYVRGGDAGLARRDGWLHTGDLGARDSDGRITFRGLRKPMFTRNGFNVYPRELERAVLDMPGVRSARVVAVPEPTHEHDIVLHVAGAVTVADVERWCAERLSAYKQPREILVTRHE
jgi:long-chain acyl-CoA synthetase